MTPLYRWNIFLANLDPTIGSEQGKTRPVIVVSEEEVNRVLNSVTVLPISSRKSGRILYPNEALITDLSTGLELESIVLCHQIRTLDKRRLVKHIGEVSSTLLQSEILEAVRFHLGI